jgi:hypothetical protein
MLIIFHPNLDLQGEIQLLIYGEEKLIILNTTCGHSKVGLHNIASITNFLQSNIKVCANIMDIL